MSDKLLTDRLIQRSRALGASTLIELLVAIAILASLLLPALSPAKEKDNHLTKNIAFRPGI